MSIITLGVADLQRARNFYEKGLGLTVSNHSVENNIVFFEMKGAWLALYPRDALAEDISIDSEGSGFSGVTLAHNLRTKEAVDGLFQQVTVAGATIVKSPQATDWGGYSGYFQDLDGHYWEIAYNPHFWIE